MSELTTVVDGMVYHYLEVVNQSTSEVTRVQLVLYTTITGQYERNNYYQIIKYWIWITMNLQSGGTQPSSTYGGQYKWSAIDTLTGKSITLAAGTYKFRYSIRFAAQGGVYVDVDASGNASNNYSSTTTSGFDYSYLSYSNNQFSIIVPTNIIELTSKGLQILNDSDTYVQINRLGSGFGSQPILNENFWWCVR